MTSRSSDPIGLRLFADPQMPATAVQENARDEFVVYLPSCHGHARIVCDNGVLFDGEVRPGLMRVLAPGERVSIFRRSAAEGAALTIPGRMFRRIAEERGPVARGAMSLVDPVIEPDPGVERLGRLLAGAADVDPAQRPLFVEGVALAILAIALGRRRPGARAPAAGLTERQLACSREYAESRIADGLTLAGWAQAVGMTASEFTRRFRDTTRTSPYAWFLERRIEAAKAMLARGDADLATVALDAGFSSQSHFTEVFRRRVGLSPGRWRREVSSRC